MSTDLKVKSTPIAIAVAASITMAGSAFAQDEPGFSIEEVVVTARKIEESLQDVPISVTAFDSEDIAARSIEELDDIALMTPGLTYEDFSNGGFGAPAIRGATQLSITQLEQNVSTFLDGVYIPRQYAVDIGMVDLARVEVVKGPQSALYGANAFMGAINYVSEAPNIDEFEADVSVTIGSDARKDLSGSVNLPISPGLFAVRLNAATSEFDGDWENTHPDANAGVSPGTDGNLAGWDKSSVGISMELSPTDSLAIELSYKEFDNQTETRAQSRITKAGFDMNCSFDAGSAGFPPFVPPSPPAMQLWCGELPRTPIEPNSAGGATTEAGFVVDPRTYGLDAETEFTRFAIDWDLSDQMSLYYQFSNIEGEVFSAGISDRDALVGSFDFLSGDSAIRNAASILPVGTFDYDTHEIRVDFTADSGLYAMVGAFYMDGEDDDDGGFSFYELGDLTPITEIPTFPFRPSADRLTITETQAIFARIQYPMMDEKLVLSAEARYTDEEKMVTNFGEDFPYKDDYVTPRLSLDYKLSDDSLLYASVAQGVKSGGVNGGSSDSFTLVDSDRFYGRDENTSFEIGSKNTLMDGRMQLNVAAYLIDWSDLQVSTLPQGAPQGTSAILTNLGSAESKGIEADLLYATEFGLSFNAGLALLDATYDKGVISERIAATGVSLCYQDVVCSEDGDVGGNELARVADVQWNIGTQYDGSLASGLDYFVRADLVGQSDQYVSEINTATIPSRKLLDLRAGIGDGAWSAELWVKNAADKEYVSNAFFIANDFQVEYVPTWGNKRRLGLTLDYKF